MKLSFDGKRLKEARVFNKLSITELADKLKVSKQMISKYENNKVEPSLEKSLQFFNILGFPREFFYSSENFTYKSHGTFFRSRLTATKKSKQPAEYLLKYALIIRNFLEEYIE
ncbi:helix-turn-helix domain-containing protein, partial [Staphylococcus simulans]